MPDPLINSYGQPIGAPLPGWTKRPRPERTDMEGRLVRLAPLDPELHGDLLYAPNMADGAGVDWTYLPYGPFETAQEYRTWLDGVAAQDDPLFFTIVDQATRTPVGLLSYLRIDPANGVIEIGHIKLGRAVQRSAGATEAIFLMMKRAFDELGYRRFEWKCNALNAPSRRAAARFGFTFEGVFRQAIVVKGRNRDTAWYSIIDAEWPRVKAAFELWLEPANFDEAGRQRRSLADIRAAIG